SVLAGLRGAAGSLAAQLRDRQRLGAGEPGAGRLRGGPGAWRVPPGGLGRDVAAVAAVGGPPAPGRGPGPRAGGPAAAGPRPAAEQGPDRSRWPAGLGPGLLPVPRPRVRAHRLGGALPA